MAKVAFDAPRGTVFNLNPDDVVLIEDESHPLYDPRVHLPVQESMVRSIIAKGVVQPIVVVKDGPHAVCVAGRQRVKSAREANKRLRAQGATEIRIPATLRRDDEKSAADVMILENEIRSADPVTLKARKAKRLFDMGRSETEIADLFGVTVQTVGNWLTLLDLHEDVQASVEAGRITMVTAVKDLAKLTKAEQKKALAKAEKASGRTGKKSAKGEPKKRGVTPVGRMKRIATHAETLPAQVQTVLRWLKGEITDGDLVEAFPRLSSMVDER